MSSPAISATGLTKRYGDTTAVSDLSVSVPAGSVYGFLGPNGAGKTTTMRLLTALTKPTAGTATVAGVSLSDRRELTQLIGYLPADPPVFDELTGWEQLRHVARLHGLADDRADDRIETLLARFDLRDAADRRIGEYSTGMTKKIGLIAAVIHEPSVIFLDEPTAGLDPRAARTVRETITALTSQERTVLLSTHVLSVADELADTIGVIDDGTLLATGSPATIKHKAAAADSSGLEQAFLALTADDSEREPETNVVETIDGASDS